MDKGGGGGDIHGTLMRTSTFLKINTVEPCQKANASGQKRQRYTSFILRKEKAIFSVNYYSFNYFHYCI